jgi:hypothetical protein
LSFFQNFKQIFTAGAATKTNCGSGAPAQTHTHCVPDGVPIVPVGEGGHNEEGQEHGRGPQVEQPVIGHALFIQRVVVVVVVRIQINYEYTLLSRKNKNYLGC